MSLAAQPGAPLWPAAVAELALMVMGAAGDVTRLVKSLLWRYNARRRCVHESRISAAKAVLKEREDEIEAN